MVESGAWPLMVIFMVMFVVLVVFGAIWLMSHLRS
jgi:heme/copper-type cytochrome/quinol oxidase subunit 4